MRNLTNSQSGFTAVELLATLFVAAMFLIAGYQLFNIVLSDGSDTRNQSRASNVAYDNLRKYTDSVTKPCTASNPLVNSPITIEGIAGAKLSVSISCPVPTAPSLSKVESTLVYGLGNEQQTVKRAIFVDKS